MDWANHWAFALPALALDPFELSHGARPLKAKVAMCGRVSTLAMAARSTLERVNAFKGQLANITSLVYDPIYHALWIGQSAEAKSLHRLQLSFK